MMGGSWVGSDGQWLSGANDCFLLLLLGRMWFQ